MSVIGATARRRDQPPLFLYVSTFTPTARRWSRHKDLFVAAELPRSPARTRCARRTSACR
jgi:hypothetical protein